MKKGTKFKHLTWNDRLTIDRMIRKGYHKQIIADSIGCTLKTVYNELKRATYTYLTSELEEEIRYNPDESQQIYERHLSEKGSTPKLRENSKLKQYIQTMIIDLKYSPEAILLNLKSIDKSFDIEVTSVTTIYTAIKKGYFERITMVDLPRRGRHIKKKKKILVQKVASPGVSIEKRPEEISNREIFGHWEMDCVVGKTTNRKTLLVLTERKTRYEIIEQLKEHTAVEVVKALNRIEKRFQSDFYKIFKTITVDNGSEFKDYVGMEKALYRKGKRTNVYYCHPHAPHERGTNENNNHLVRRFFPKSADFDVLVKRKKVKDAEFWMNSYPRRLFNGLNALERFVAELTDLGCRVIF